MKTIEIYWFKDINCFDSLKTRYKELVKQYHPDLGSGDLESMQLINAEYDYLLANLAKLHDKTINPEAEDSFKDMILELSKLDLIIEICGSWLWLHGDTKPIKEDLKALGCHWAAKKKLWYWASGPKKSRRGNFTMSEIRAKYGSYTVDNNKRKLLHA